MRFAEAVDFLEKNEGYSMYRESWSDDVFVIIVGGESTGMSKYFVVRSRNGIVPWIPNMIEMLTNDDWWVQKIVREKDL